jgi:hypothetical protein
VTAFAGVEGGRDLPPGQGFELGVQAGLVVLHGQDVMRLFLGDQEPGVLALGMQRIGGHHPAGQVQRGQQRRERCDLIGLAVHLGLREHRAGLLVCGRQQVPGLAITAGMPGSAHRLAIHRHCPPLPPPTPRQRAAGLQPGGQPRSHRGLQRGGIHRFQHPPERRLIRRLEPPRQRVIADPQRGQHPRRGIGGPLADRGERPRPRQHRRQ